MLHAAVRSVARENTARATAAVLSAKMLIMITGYFFLAKPK